MSSSRMRSKTGCLTCKNRRKKCDEKRPICERCTRAGMECLGYSYLDEAADRTKRPREKPTGRVSRSVSDAAGPSRQPKAKFIVGPSVLPSSSSSLVLPWNNLLLPQVDSATSGFCTSSSDYSQWNLDQGTSVPLPGNICDLSFLSDPSTALFEVQLAVEGSWEANSVNPRSSIQQPQEPPDGFGLTLDQSPSYLAPALSDLHNPPLASHSARSASPSNTTTCMTAGQASLFQALFSLGHPQTDSPQFPDHVSQTPPSSHGSPWPSPDTEQDEDSSATSEDSDPEGIREIVCRTPTMDRNVPSNSLAFVLSSYSKWMTRTVFEPLKMANQARQYLTRRYVQSEDSRWTVTLMANVVRLLISSPMLTSNYLPTISMLHQRVFDSLTLVKFRPDPSPEARKKERQDALDDLLEVVPMLCLTSPLPTVLALLHEAAPVFRSICHEPLGEPISLPRKLIDPECSLRHFPAMDILFSTCLCKPMIFQYDLSYSSDMCEGLTDSDVLGLQWMHGIPDQFIMMLARINMLRQESGATWDANTVLELETEIKEFKPVLGQSTDALLSVGRLAVQESWRQAMYVYLYMGLCGANAVDCRVERAFKGFIRLVEGIRPGRTPDAFLMIPMIILGVAARRQRDRDLIHRRQTSVRECSQANTPGHQSRQALLDIWSRTDAEGRPAVWGDLRLAHARVAGA